MGSDDSDSLDGLNNEKNMASSSLDLTALSTEDSDEDIGDLKKSKAKRTFNWLFVKRAWAISRLIYPRFFSWASLYVSLTVLCAVGEELIVYQVGMIPSKYYGVFGAQDTSAFTTLTLAAVGIVSAVALVKALKEWFGGRFGVEARNNVTMAVHHKCFMGLRHYMLSRSDTVADNLDQRLTTDADQFCSTYGTILTQATVLPFLIAYYSYECFKVTGWLGPVSVYAYFVVGALANKIFMGLLSAYIYRLERREGDFRFHHAQLRGNAESVALYRGGKSEEQFANSALKNVIDTQQATINRELLVHSCNYWFSYFGSILSYIIVAIPVFSGAYSDPTEISTLVSKYSFVTMYLINCFSRLFDLSATLATFAGFSHRLGELVEVADAINTEDIPPHVKVRSSIEVTLRVRNLTYRSPGSHHNLCEGLSFDLTENTLVVGPSGCGKSSLLRVLSGIWRPVSGTVELRTGPFLYAIPQKPYALPSGTLRDQVSYPTGNDGQDDAYVRECLEQAGLHGLLSRMGGIDCYMEGWATTLSPGEVQRLCFARLFFHRPTLAALDESTSSLDEATESQLYEHCARLGITLLSIGHRSSLRKFHRQLIELDGQGTWVRKEL